MFRCCMISYAHLKSIFDMIITGFGKRCSVTSVFNKIIRKVFKIYMCHGFVSAGDALGRECPATPMSSFLAGRSGCK